MSSRNDGMPHCTDAAERDVTAAASAMKIGHDDDDVYQEDDETNCWI